MGMHLLVNEQTNYDSALFLRNITAIQKPIKLKLSLMYTVH